MQAILTNDLLRPGAKSVQAVVLKPKALRLLIGQQYGVRPDGTLEKGLKAQLERAWMNGFAVLAGAGFDKQDLIKTTVYVTEPGRMMMVREIRDRMLNGHACLSACIQVAALQHPALLCELEIEAAKD